MATLIVSVNPTVFDLVEGDRTLDSFHHGEIRGKFCNIVDSIIKKEGNYDTESCRTCGIRCNRIESLENNKGY